MRSRRDAMRGIRSLSRRLAARSRPTAQPGLDADQRVDLAEVARKRCGSAGQHFLDLAAIDQASADEFALEQHALGKVEIAQQDFFDALEDMDASSEEADEFVNMCMEA